jgi:hypothetical protein
MRQIGSSRSGWARGCGGRRAARALLAACLLAPFAASGGTAQVWEVGEQGLFLPLGAQGAAQYGQVTVSADFNGDGFADLAVGAPLWDQTSPPAAADGGRVDIYLGSPAGLAGVPITGLSGALANTELGSALAAGDFDRDGIAELAIGAPGFDIAGQNAAGRIFVLDHAGGSWDLTFWDQETPGVPGGAEAGDRLGQVLATGDFDNDGYSDLAGGMPFEDFALADSGAVLVLYGAAGGLAATGSQLFVQTDLTSPEQTGTAMGAALATGDFNDDDQFFDLAIGFPGIDLAGESNAGGVAVLLGSASGLTLAGAVLVHDGVLGGEVEADDGFGSALAAGDFNRTPGCWLSFACNTDLAIGVPGEDLPGAADAGEVAVLYGSGGAAPGALLSGSFQRFDQGDLDDSSSAPETGDRFGAVLWSEWLVAAALDGPRPDATPSADDLLIGVPYEAWNSTNFQGIVHLVFGGSAGLNTAPGQYRLAAAGLSSAPPAAFDNFAGALALGDFDDDGWNDIAIGVAGRDAGAPNSGMVQILYGALFADGFETGGLVNW